MTPQAKGIQLKTSILRSRRAARLATDVMEWARLASQQRYPCSLVDILKDALKREYDLGRRRGNR